MCQTDSPHRRARSVCMCVCSGGLLTNSYCRVYPHLLLVLVLHAESLLDAVAGLQEGFPLGSLCQDAHKQP